MYISDAQVWVENIRPIISNYSSEILNSGHCSFQQEYVSPRILSFTVERTNKVAVRKKKKNIAHSYTMQPITSTDGSLLDKFLLIL